MILLDFPYVSDYMQECLVQAHLPVIKTASAMKLELRNDIHWVTEDQAISAFRSNPDLPLYSNSENAISWISENLAFTDIPDKINMFKDKFRFRQELKLLYPDYYFEELQLGDFDSFAQKNLPYPLILKPAVGFFSLGVYKLNSRDDWSDIKSKMKQELQRAGQLYPAEVFNASRFILEACIQGREFAVDAYFNDKGKAVILNLTEHFFSSPDSFSDRLYQSKLELFDELYSPFLQKLQVIGDITSLRNFPVHVELRLTPDDTIIPIEINPMRFGGWCTTADLAAMSFGINPYQMFLNREQPNWEEIYSSRKEKAYNLLLLDNNTGIEGNEIKAFDYDKLSSRFKNVMELRKVNFSKNPLFGFLFIETTKEEEPLLQELLKSNLKEYIIT